MLKLMASNQILPARAGVILVAEIKLFNSDNFTRTSGGDPVVESTGISSSLILPARAGVIRYHYYHHQFFCDFTRTSGGDPIAQKLFCF